MSKLGAEQLQPAITDHFKQILAHGELAHAYLFVGPSGSGKQELATWLTLRLFCQHPQNGEPDMTCPECERVLSGNHPDFIKAQAEGRVIKVDTVRRLKREFSKTAMEGQQKVFMIDDADKLTPGAANSLLKFIEEPGPGIYIFMMTANRNAILPTIQSRTQVVEMQPLPAAMLEKMLQEAGVPAPLLPVVLGLTDSVDEAQAMMADDWLSKLVPALIRWFKELAGGDPLAFTTIQTDIMPLIKNTDQGGTCLDLMALLWRDALVAASQADQPLRFAHWQDAIATAISQDSLAQITQASEIMLAARPLLQSNISFQNAAEQATLQVLKLMGHWG